MKRIHMLLLALLSALLFSIPFFRWGTGLFLIVAFVPLLFIEEEISRQKKLAAERAVSFTGRKRRKQRSPSMIWFAFFCFAIFVSLTTYWIYFATWIGLPATIIVNGGYMTLTFLVFHHTRRKLGDRLGYASLAIFWLAFEFLYIRAQINFPWILLGNGFANDVILIQWYEITGVLGGSLWVLVLNILIYKLIRDWATFVKDSSNANIKLSGKIETRLSRKTETKLTGKTEKRLSRKTLTLKALKETAPSAFQANRSRLSWVVAIFILPLIFSVSRYLTYEENEDPYEIVVLQPNIDPYMKFAALPQDEQTAYLLNLADSLVTPNTDYIVGPETFINRNVWQSSMAKHPDFLKLYDFLDDYPKAKLVMGATTYKLYKNPSDFTTTSRPMRNTEYRYDSYNTAFQLDSTSAIPLYHKSMLVTGVEKMPHANILGFLQKLVVRLGGTMRGPGTQAFRDAFASPQDSTRVGPVICWESVFGEYVTDYVGEAGANFLFIITNDGWWRNTPGHRQHNSFARLRAIENRRGVARSANTGISSLIDQRGKELARCGWWERTGLRGTLNKNDHLTFYTRHGDFIGRIAVLLTVILLLYSFVVKYIRK